MKKHKLIGLTGQSGAGKSTVSRMFAEKGWMTVSADALVKSIYESGSVCLIAVAAAFGRDVLFPDGSLNRVRLAEKAFSSKKNTALLGEIVHPFVTAGLIKRLKNTDAEIVVYDAPQLFESGFDVLCDLVVSVTASESVRLERILARDNITREQALERFNAQNDEAFFRENSDIIIENNSDGEALRKITAEVIAVIEKEVN